MTEWIGREDCLQGGFGMNDFGATALEPFLFRLIKNLVNVVAFSGGKEDAAGPVAGSNALYAQTPDRDLHFGLVQGYGGSTILSRGVGDSNQIDVGGGSDKQKLFDVGLEDSRPGIDQSYGGDAVRLFLKAKDLGIWEGVVPEVERVVNGDPGVIYVGKEAHHGGDLGLVVLLEDLLGNVVQLGFLEGSPGGRRGNVIVRGRALTYVAVNGRISALRVQTCIDISRGPLSEGQIIGRISSVTSSGIELGIGDGAGLGWL